LEEHYMSTGFFSGYIDVAQLVLYAFWIFFAGLIYYLRREDKREGYPLETDRPRRIIVQGFPPIPDPKTFVLADGSTRVAPRPDPSRSPLAAAPVGPWPGAPLEPTGDPMLDAVGPASYALRPDVPDRTLEGLPKIVPLRIATDFAVAARDPNPCGMDVIGADGGVSGTVCDVWVDRSEVVIRYLEVEVAAPGSARRVLLPITFTRIDKWRHRVNVKSILAGQFANVPPVQHPDEVTLLEEDRIAAYYASGHLYATPSRLGPYL
jgi:photosynthetic reaction center H subunit